MKQAIKCFLGCHTYAVIKETEVKNSYNIIIGTCITSRCVCCGKIKNTYIYTDSNYIRR